MLDLQDIRDCACYHDIYYTYTDGWNLMTENMTKDLVLLTQLYGKPGIRRTWHYTNTIIRSGYMSRYYFRSQEDLVLFLLSRE